MTTTAKKKEEQKANLMYIGPTISGVARYSTVFKEGVLPDRLKECVKEFPQTEITGLYCAFLSHQLRKEELQMKKLNEKNSVLSTICTQVKNKFKEA